MQVAGVTLVPQVVIRDHDGEFVARVDFVVEGTSVVVEFDGKVKYGDGNGDVLFQGELARTACAGLVYTVRVTGTTCAGRSASWRGSGRRPPPPEPDQGSLGRDRTSGEASSIG